MENLQNNFKAAPWYEESSKHTISVLGAGGIGSNTIYNLAKTLLSTIVIIDFDAVEEHNIGSQFFKLRDRGSPKVRALEAALGEYLGSYRRCIGLVGNINQYIPKQYCTPITISAFDNMDARKKSFEDWKSLDDRLLYIDGRLRATQYEVFCVVPGLEEKYEGTLFTSGDVPPDPCTFKQTSYAGMMIGARITSFVTNFLYNYTLKEEICSVPFHYKELLELCHTEVEEMPKLNSDAE